MFAADDMSEDDESEDEDDVARTKTQLDDIFAKEEDDDDEEDEDPLFSDINKKVAAKQPVKSILKVKMDVKEDDHLAPMA